PTRLVPDFFVFEGTQRDGAFLTAGDLNGDGFADVVCGGGPNGGPRVLVLDGQMLAPGQTPAPFAPPVANFFPGDPASPNGVLLGSPNADADERADLVVIDPAAGVAHLYRGADLAGGGEPTPLPFDAPLDGVFVG